MPHKLMSSENADWRLLIPAAFVLIGAAAEPFRNSRGALAVGVFALAVNAAAAYGAWTQWRDGDDIFAELRAALEPLPEGALLLPYLPGEEELRNAYLPPSLLHAATHGVRERKALIPTILARHGQQPIRVADRYKATREWSALLRAGEPLPQGAERAVDAGTYVLRIRTDYDVTRPVPPLAVPADQLVRTQHFTLYRLKAPAAEPDQAGGGG